jgi:hypothetical protein
MADWLPVPASDEQAHAPGPEPLWGESWYFDFFAPDGAFGGWVRVGLYPNLGVTWYHAYLVGSGRPTIAVAEYEAALPKPGRLELRANGLWAEHVCETALDHWTVGNEAFGLAVEDPADLYSPIPTGEPVPIGFDLEWETAGEPYHYVHTTRYEIPCSVHGEIAVGDERLALDGFGQRDHSWGVRDWWQFDWCWTAGRLEEGTRFHGSDIRISDVDVGFGYEQHDTRRIATNAVAATETLGSDGFPTDGAITIGDLALGIEPIAFAPALLQHEGHVSRFPRALCRFIAGDGRAGFGWTEWNQVQRPGQ